MMCHPSTLIKVVLGSFFLLVGLTDSSVPTYKWTDNLTGEQITCQRCPPGTYVAKHCTTESITDCQPCPDQHYAQYWNYLEECRFCNVFCESQGKVKHECNSTHNRVCECPSGYYQGPHMCVKHTKCQPGYGVSQKGTSEMDTKCVRCAAGTFSSISFSMNLCRPHRNCTKDDLFVNAPGTIFHDTICSTCKNLESLEDDDNCFEAALDLIAYKIWSSRRHFHKILKDLQVGKKSHKKIHDFLKRLSKKEVRKLLRNCQGTSFTFRPRSMLQEPAGL
ncbi:tumor necrosis factor receptor superfamily member 6B [Pelobates fuscus]|uniref:tumor necrosis factor receptor superfamily member 6B n=1 Tax=Pelobates fuscus TaxID=191477 RepID=UPI002FE4A0A4